jgi:hypothetical protein
VKSEDCKVKSVISVCPKFILHFAIFTLHFQNTRAKNTRVSDKASSLGHALFTWE